MCFDVMINRGESDDDDDDNSDTDEDEEENAAAANNNNAADPNAKPPKKEQRIPEWAKGDKFRKALERQYGMNGQPPMDPDSIFSEVQSCNLEEIFGRDAGPTRK